MKATVRVDELNGGPVRVTGGDVDREIAAGESFVVETSGGDVTLTQVTDPKEIPAAQQSLDVWDHGNPNGIGRAEIAPKMPKSSGELADVVEGDRIVQRAVADIGVATQGGGPESTDGTTPGPKPEPTPTGRVADRTGTGDAVGGRPVGLDAASRERSARGTGAKKGAAKGGRRAAR